MTGTVATRIGHDQQPGRSDMDEHQRDECLRTAYRAADQEWRAAGEAAHRPSPEDLDAAYDRAHGGCAARPRSAVRPRPAPVRGGRPKRG